MEKIEILIVDAKVKAPMTYRTEVVTAGLPQRASSPGSFGIIVVEDALAMEQASTPLGEYPSGDLILSKSKGRFTATSKQTQKVEDITNQTLLMACKEDRLVVSILL